MLIQRRISSRGSCIELDAIPLALHFDPGRNGERTALTILIEECRGDAVLRPSV